MQHDAKQNSHRGDLHADPLTRRVVVIDDDEILLQLMNIGLRDSLWQGEFYQDSEEALDALSNRMVDALCVDINMPGMTGIEFLERCAANKVFQAQHVFAMSMAPPKREDANRLRDLGVDTVEKGILMKRGGFVGYLNSLSV